MNVSKLIVFSGILLNSESTRDTVKPKKMSPTFYDSKFGNQEKEKSLTSP